MSMPDGSAPTERAGVSIVIATDYIVTPRLMVDVLDGFDAGKMLKSYQPECKMILTNKDEIKMAAMQLEPVDREQLNR